MKKSVSQKIEQEQSEVNFDLWINEGIGLPIYFIVDFQQRD